MRSFDFLNSLDIVRLAYISSGVAGTLRKYKRFGSLNLLDDRDFGFIAEAKNFFVIAQKGINPFVSRPNSKQISTFICYIKIRHITGKVHATNYKEVAQELTEFLQIFDTLKDTSTKYPIDLDTIIKFFECLGKICLLKLWVISQDEQHK